jgi:hypothetical protein
VSSRRFGDEAAKSVVPNNQPVTTKYIYYARQQGTRVAVIELLCESRPTDRHPSLIKARLRGNQAIPRRGPRFRSR